LGGVTAVEKPIVEGLLTAPCRGDGIAGLDLLNEHLRLPAFHTLGEIGPSKFRNLRLAIENLCFQ
jgi:hypothetical protein